MVVPVNIPDRNLRAKIKEALGKAPGATITTVDMANLTVLVDAENANITNLTGLEAAINLASAGDLGQLHIRHLTSGELNKPDTTVAFR